ncbi:MAG TPA: phosphatase PAP2 family protein [Acidobacteriota bacterium]
MSPAILTLDRSLFLLLQPALSLAPLDALMRILSWSGTLEANLLLLGLGLVFGMRWAPRMALIGLVVFACVTALKSEFQRPRPYLVEPLELPFNIRVLQDDSFPSGHAAAALMLAVGLGSAYRRARWPLALWATGVCLSRIALGVHYPIDVLAGALLGGSLTWLLMRLPFLAPPPPTRATT